jgi:hypothetical protein
MSNRAKDCVQLVVAEESHSTSFRADAAIRVREPMRFAFAGLPACNLLRADRGTVWQGHGRRTEPVFLVPRGAVFPLAELFSRVGRGARQHPMRSIARSTV